MRELEVYNNFFRSIQSTSFTFFWGLSLMSFVLYGHLFISCINFSAFEKSMGCIKNDYDLMSSSNPSYMEGRHMKIVDILVAIILILGGLNWGVFGLLNINILQLIFSHQPLIERLIYIVVGLAALYQILQWKAIKQRWRQ